MIDKKKRIKGCHGRGVDFFIEDIQYNTCPGNLFNVNAQRLIDMFMMYEKGVLPFPGSFSEQPAKVLDAFGIIQSFKQRKEAEAAEKASRQSK